MVAITTLNDSLQSGKLSKIHYQSLEYQLIYIGLASIKVNRECVGYLMIFQEKNTMSNHRGDYYHKNN